MKHNNRFSPPFTLVEPVARILPGYAGSSSVKTLYEKNDLPVCVHGNFVCHHRLMYYNEKGLPGKQACEIEERYLYLMNNLKQYPVLLFVLVPNHDQPCTFAFIFTN